MKGRSDARPALLILTSVQPNSPTRRAAAKNALPARGPADAPHRNIFGKITIGVGRNLPNRGLVANEIDLLIANDIAIAITVCVDLYGAALTSATPALKMALLSMAFNLGGPRFSGFRRMHAAVLYDIWLQVASEALHS